MKHINLISKEPFFPISVSLQKRIIFLIFVVFVVYNGLKVYYSFKMQRKLQEDIKILSLEKTRIKNLIDQNQQDVELRNSLEKEFSKDIDNALLVKKGAILNIFNHLSELTPDHVWITSLEIQYDNEKFLRIAGKSLNKKEIFIFMYNLKKKNNNVTLINIQSGDGHEYSFELRLDLI
jgi:hypothetical protein